MIAYHACRCSSSVACSDVTAAVLPWPHQSSGRGSIIAGRYSVGPKVIAVAGRKQILTAFESHSV